MGKKPTATAEAGKVSIAMIGLVAVILLALVFVVRGCRGTGNRAGYFPEPTTDEIAVERVSPVTGQVVVPFYMKKLGPGTFRYRLPESDQWLETLPPRLKDPSSGKVIPAEAYVVPVKGGGAKPGSF